METCDHLLRQAKALADDLKEIDTIDVDAAYRKTRHQIRINKRHSLFMAVQRYAALFALPLLLSSLLLGYLYFRPQQVEVRYAEAKASAGGVLRYELPDGSVVWLNSGSKLRYPITFNRQRREVTLSGEGYFAVHHNPKQPFDVTTPDGLTVQVLGTKFNVNAYEGETSTEVTLEEGIVDVAVPSRQGSIRLQPSEQLRYDKLSHQLTKQQVDVYSKVAWRDGLLIFRNATLEEVFDRLERHFNVNIHFMNHTGEEYRYRATFRHETLPQILNYLAKSATLKWKIQAPVMQDDESYSKEEIYVELH